MSLLTDHDVRIACAAQAWYLPPGGSSQLVEGLWWRLAVGLVNHGDHAAGAALNVSGLSGVARPRALRRKG
jgi:hypothetical protein